MKSPITTHVLDTALGRPAAGVPVRLERRKGGGGWEPLARGVTDADGRVADLLPGAPRPASGVYRLSFDTGAYFARRGAEAFYPYVEIVFALEKPEEHHHVPLLLSPFGYSTYRGS
ncbi:MAG: hydroxyisourate hydrolase [Elusimicrobia bacterium]|nr:hydroxyisourate hydrolase [Elusimicrobiota bacterium]